MSHPQLAIFGYSEAAMFLRTSPKPDVVAIVSIRGSHEFGVEFDVVHRLDLTFDDVDIAPPGDVLALQRILTRKRWAEQNGLNETPPQISDAAAIIDFAEKIRIENGLVLFHCGDGMSRAPAAALISLAVWRGPGTESECVAEIKRLRPGATPHRGLAGFADEYLARGGNLLHALDAFRQ
jgi:predicted protein tyrosine phosphatase